MENLVLGDRHSSVARVMNQMEAKINGLEEMNVTQRRNLINPEQIN